MPQGHFPHPDCTAWHITVGTARARLHGGPRKTVERSRNKPGEPFVEHDEWREFLAQLNMIGEPVLLNESHRTFIEQALPEICAEGGWTYDVCAAPPPPENDHFHVLLDAPKSIHGKEIRKWLKRWLTEQLNERFEGPPDGREQEGPASRAFLVTVANRAGDELSSQRPPSPRPWWVKGGSTKPVKDPPYFMNTMDYIRRQRTTPFVLECERGNDSCD